MVVRSCASALSLISDLFIFKQVRVLASHSQIANEHLSSESSEPLTDRTIPDVGLVPVNIDQPCVPADVLVGIVISVWLPLEQQQDSLFKSVTTIKKVERPLNILLFKDKLEKPLLPLNLVCVDFRVLA